MTKLMEWAGGVVSFTQVFALTAAFVIHAVIGLAALVFSIWFLGVWLF